MNDNSPIQSDAQEVVAAGTIATALAKAQTEMGAALKSANNPHFKSKYADLSSVVSACMPALNSNGIAVIQPTGEDETGRYVETVLIHGASGQSLSCRVPLIVQKNDMQGYGSAVTYARRYGLMSMAGIAPEDDDGNAAAKAPPRSEPKAPKEPVINPAALDTAKQSLLNADTLDQLRDIFTDLPTDVKAHRDVINAKDLRKGELSKPADHLDGDGIPDFDGGESQ